MVPCKNGHGHCRSGGRFSFQISIITSKQGGGQRSESWCPDGISVTPCAKNVLGRFERKSYPQRKPENISPMISIDAEALNLSDSCVTLYEI